MIAQADLGHLLSVSTAPPALPFAYGPGQPAAVVGLTVECPAGILRVEAEYNGYLVNDGSSAVQENQAFADFAIFVDGVQQGRARAQTYYEQQPTAFGGPGKITDLSGTIARYVTVSAGLHTFELRAGVTGAGPRATAVIDPTNTVSEMLNQYARLVVQSV